MKAVPHSVVWEIAQEGLLSEMAFISLLLKELLLQRTIFFPLVVCYYAEENSYGETLEAFSGRRKLFLLLVGDRLFWLLLFVSYVVK